MGLITPQIQWQILAVSTTDNVGVEIMGPWPYKMLISWPFSLPSFTCHCTLEADLYDAEAL